MSEEIKECPFCGCDGLLDQTSNSYSVLCSGCGCETDGYIYPVEAVSAWNKRTPSQEIKHLKNKVKELKESNEWISVEDRLPNTAISILFTDGTYVCAGFYASAHNEFVINFTSIVNKIDVTHWKPITPPKEVNR